MVLLAIDYQLVNFCYAASRMRKIKIMIRIKTILILLIFVSACGYHLRGSEYSAENLKKIYLQGASSQLQQDFKKAFRFSVNNLVDDINQAEVVVKIIRENMDKQALSLGSTGRANEFELSYDLQFILLDKAGNKLSKKQTIAVNRDYFNDQKYILAKENEEQVIMTEMYHQAVESIINISRTLLKN